MLHIHPLLAKILLRYKLHLLCSETVKQHISDRAYNTVTQQPFCKIAFLRCLRRQRVLFICCVCARWQMGAVGSPSLPPSPQVGSVWVYDPVLSEDELVVVESFGCRRIPVNEACRRAVSHPTLFFMLHCGMAMYTNLLGANWGREGLRHVAILGNPLSSYHLR